MKIPAQILEVVRLSSTDLQRENINSVHFERADESADTPSVAVATNGRYMIEAEFTEPDHISEDLDLPDSGRNPQFIGSFTRDSIKEILRVAKGSDTTVIIGENGESLSEYRLVGPNNENRGQFTARKTNEELPDRTVALQRLEDEECAATHFDPFLLIDLLTTITKVCGLRRSGPTSRVEMRVPKESGAPIFFHCEADGPAERVNAALMPLRTPRSTERKMDLECCNETIPVDFNKLD